MHLPEEAPPGKMTRSTLHITITTSKYRLVPMEESAIFRLLAPKVVQADVSQDSPVRVEVTAPEPGVAGVGYDDLPLLGPKPNDALLEYHQLPVLRKLDWRADEHGVPVRRPLKDIVSQTAAFAHTRGSEVQAPCHHCKVNKSVWKTCVVGFDTKEGSNMHGACTCCRFSRRYCSLTARGPDQNASPDSQHHFSGDDTYGPRSEIALRPLVMTPTPGGNEALHETPVKTQSYWDPVHDGIKSERDNVMSSPVSCRLDGDVIPFPLGPETIDNLSLLKQAAKEMEIHLETIKRRIKQLEEKDKAQRDIINPWDLV
ncbi:hypothetical protein BO78DRAFT_471324 [Aspergillus sclerotiicarbonarius CBS 121057]|uniref:Uncharacterized protein n=1 Tax=Aspergillus sclerotiicarbonarius (strain CBS 121057 / IBT 28362) TaxID=1448318 RepID=A0A319FD89_ASPSB|nr:hypothetical protein BO78DRAFT_471324 [Aspergillus sclerotiicarbonarius CBS 121057]